MRAWCFRSAIAIAVVATFAISSIAWGALSAPVAVVAGVPIAQRTFDHWMTITARGRSSRPSSFVVVPVDPPAFPKCVALAGRHVARLDDASRSAIVRYCAKLFASLRNEALDYLIRAQWVEQLARSKQVVVSDHEVMHEFRTSKRSEFQSDADFRRFLRDTGQTVADILFRVRVNVTAQKLAVHSDLNQLENEQRKLYRPKTLCSRYYRIPDCANG
jgi:hypothetical protein